jgi:preprotein translocase subunit SecE
VQNFKIQKMNKISIYFKESYKELTEKVSWPNWAQLQQSTMIVLISTILLTLVVWLAMDSIISFVLKNIYKFLH